MIDTFEPLLRAASGLDLGNAAAAREELGRRLEPSSEQGRALAGALVGLWERGEVAGNGEAPLRWGRVAKAGAQTRDFSIDVVVMSAAGPEHRHPRGEVNFCVALDGEPTFEGQPPGWVVMPSESTHVPTVAGGTMLIVYLLPGGEIEFLGRP